MTNKSNIGYFKTSMSASTKKLPAMQKGKRGQHKISREWEKIQQKITSNDSDNRVARQDSRVVVKYNGKDEYCEEKWKI